MESLTQQDFSLECVTEKHMKNTLMGKKIFTIYAKIILSKPMVSQ